MVGQQQNGWPNNTKFSFVVLRTIQKLWLARIGWLFYLCPMLARVAAAASAGVAVFAATAAALIVKETLLQSALKSR